MGDKSHVSMEQHVCIVCWNQYDTGAILLHKRLRQSLERHTITGEGLCPEHQKLHEEGFLALVECDESKSSVRSGANGDIIKPGEEYRTGTITHIRRTAARQIFNVDIPDDLPMMFCPPDLTAKLQEMIQA